jgi:hypothetical protein
LRERHVHRGSASRSRRFAGAARALKVTPVARSATHDEVRFTSNEDVTIVPMNETIVNTRN